MFDMAEALEVHMGTFRNVSKSEPCPICGKPDWCCFLSPADPSYPGQELFICRRENDPQITSPINGKTYFFKKELRDNSSLYSVTETNDMDKKSESEYCYQSSISNKDCTRVQKQAADYGIPPLGNEQLDKVYRSFLGLLQLHKKHYKMLAKDGWSHELIKASGIRSLSLRKTYNASKGYFTDELERNIICKELLKKFETLTGVPGFYQDESGQWTFSRKPGMLIPVYDQNGMLYRLKLRSDQPDFDDNGKEKNKYKNFSSFYSTKDENGGLMNAFRNGSRAGSQIGIYYNPVSDASMICYITEGEKKAIVANYILKTIVISLPGVNSFSKLLTEEVGEENIIDFLKKIWCSSIVIAYDSDKYINKAVMRCEKKLVELLKNEGFNLYIAYWNPGFGKGLDDVLIVGIRPELIPA